MDYARSNLRLVRTAPATRPALVRKPRTGPVHSVPWRDFERKISLEDAFPVLILTGFAFLAAIQFLLLQ